MIHSRSIVLSVLVVAILLLGAPASAPAVSAAPPDVNLLVEGGTCVIAYGMTTCMNAKRAADWAKDVTEKKVREGVFRSIENGSMANAFQHCVWIGVLAVWTDYDTAIGIGSIHETVVVNEYPFTKMDYFNNFTGAAIGVEAVNLGVHDGRRYVIDSCESLAKDGLLYGPCGIQGNYIEDGKSQLAPAEEQTCAPN